MKLLHRKFRLPERCNCSELIIRETNGIDEQECAFRADAKGNRSNVYIELVRQSIVEVDGKKVQQPFELLEKWNSRTRAFVRQAYENLNDMQEGESEVFLAASSEISLGEEAPTPTVS